jgi:hypothetical protein
MLLNMEFGYHIVAIRVIWASWAHVWRLRSLFLRTGYDMIACWWYTPSSPSSLLSIDAWLCPHCFIGWLGREIGYGPMDRSAGVLWIASGAPFLESSGPAQLCWWLMKGCHIRGLPIGSVCRAYMDWRGKRTCHVGRVFPCRVYIDSNHRDSQIWVTGCLWQS